MTAKPCPRPQPILIQGNDSAPPPETEGTPCMEAQDICLGQLGSHDLFPWELDVIMNSSH